jgi:hypothetical protein
MRLRALLAMCFALASSWAPAAQDAPAALTPQQYEEALKAFIAEVDSSYPFFDLKGIRDDWNACSKNLMSRVKQCRSNDEFYGLLADAARCLRDAHLSFGDLKGGFPPGEPKFCPGVSFLPAVNDQVVVMDAAEEYARFLPPGAVVSTIDGQNARAFLDKQAEENWKAGGWFSSPQRARMFTYRIPLQGKEGEKHRLVGGVGNGIAALDVTCKWEAGGWPHTCAMPDGLTQKGSCLYGTLPSGFGYLYIRNLDRDLVESVDAALQSFGDVPGLIIDLRGNGGGGYNNEVFKRFDKKKGATEGIPYFGGEMVVLIDEGTFSAGETFARDLFYAANAHLMGSTTAGSSTAKRTWPLPHELGTVTFSVRSRVGLNRRPIEYNGIAPDEAVEAVPAEIQQGINSGIRRAEEYLRKKGGRTQAEPSRLLGGSRG